MGVRVRARVGTLLWHSEELFYAEGFVHLQHELVLDVLCLVEVIEGLVEDQHDGVGEVPWWCRVGELLLVARSDEVDDEEGFHRIWVEEGGWVLGVHVGTVMERNGDVGWAIDLN